MATGQESNAVQVADILLKYGSIALNIILGLIVYIFNRELKNHDQQHKALENDTKKEFELRDKDIKGMADEYERTSEDVHDSFQSISKSIKDERQFWQEFYNKIKTNIDELTFTANVNKNNIQSLQTQLVSELKRLDEKIDNLRDLFIYRKNGDKFVDRDKNDY